MCCSLQQSHTVVPVLLEVGFGRIVYHLRVEMACVQSVHTLIQMVKQDE